MTSSHVLVFCSNDKVSKIVNLGENVFGSWFQGILFMISGLHGLGARGEAEHHGGQHTVEQGCSPYGGLKGNG